MNKYQIINLLIWGKRVISPRNNNLSKVIFVSFAQAVLKRLSQMSRFFIDNKVYKSQKS